MNELNTQPHVAVRLGDKLIRHILVNNPKNGKVFYSVREGKEVVTVAWDSASNDQRDRLFRFVQANLEDNATQEQQNSLVRFLKKNMKGSTGEEQQDSPARFVQETMEDRDSGGNPGKSSVL